MHATLRVKDGLPSLRTERLFGAVREALRRASSGSFRVLHFSVQADHLHLIVEAERGELVRGLQGLAIRVAKAANRVLVRTGRVWASRYHARPLRTPREVRHALVYVLQNWRKHSKNATGLDPCSSAVWFRGWRFPSRERSRGPSAVVTPRTWLAAVGWRRRGLIDIDEAPARVRGRAGA